MEPRPLSDLMLPDRTRLGTGTVSLDRSGWQPYVQVTMADGSLRRYSVEELSRSDPMHPLVQQLMMWRLGELHRTSALAVFTAIPLAAFAFGFLLGRYTAEK